MRMIEGDRNRYQEGFDSGLLFQNAQYLSGLMQDYVKGTKDGLTDERIAAFREEVIQ